MGRPRKIKPAEVEQTEVEVKKGEQRALIDTAPENSKEIIRHAKKYKEVQTERLAALVQEKEEKQILLTLIKEANIQPVDGKISFHCDGYKITVVPRDELIRIKEEGDELEE
jgi:hypothetical protein